MADMPNTYEEALTWAERVLNLGDYLALVQRTCDDLTRRGFDAESILATSQTALLEWALLDRAASPTPSCWTATHGLVWECASAAFAGWVVSEQYADVLPVSTVRALKLLPYLVH